MNNNRNTMRKNRGDRSGTSTVEFALLLPFFFLAAATVLSAGHLFYRSVCQSHAAFSAARRCAVSGKSVQAESFILRDYRACSMPENPAVRAKFTPGLPGVCQVRVRDTMPAFMPSRRGRLVVRQQQGAAMNLSVAGTSVSMGGDND